jgi:very-short-patch-repair endonuclease
MTKWANQLRKSSTDAERKLWYHIRSRNFLNYKFHRQHLIKPSYVVDFVCLKAKLIIAVDGGHHADQITDDEQRTRYLESCGYTVLRFWNNEVLNETEAVLEKIRLALETASPSPTDYDESAPSPSRGEGKV